MIYAPTHAPSKATPGTRHGCIHETGLERLRYMPRMLLGADDLNVEQDYFRTKSRRHNRLLHGWGVTCGCEVFAAPTKEHPWRVRICPGYLLTPQGDEVVVAREAFFDLATCIVQSEDPCAFSQPCPPVQYRYKEGVPREIFLAVRYIECMARPVRIAPAGCGCDNDGCEYSRIADGYEFCCLDDLPETHGYRRINCAQLCEPRIIPCPSCPEDGWVVLATIQLSGKPDNDITNAWIDNLSHRKLLYSTEILQEMAICNCQGYGRVATASALEAAPAADVAPGGSPKQRVATTGGPATGPPPSPASTRKRPTGHELRSDK